MHVLFASQFDYQIRLTSRDKETKKLDFRSLKTKTEHKHGYIKLICCYHKSLCLMFLSEFLSGGSKPQNVECKTQ